MEFVTIGGLVAGIDLEDIYVGISQSRNERLANIFHRLKLVEAYGTGISKSLKATLNMVLHQSLKPQITHSS